MFTLKKIKFKGRFFPAFIDTTFVIYKWCSLCEVNIYLSGLCEPVWIFIYTYQSTTPILALGASLLSYRSVIPRSLVLQVQRDR